jgi:hypothetical protein
VGVIYVCDVSDDGTDLQLVSEIKRIAQNGASDFQNCHFVTKSEEFLAPSKEFVTKSEEFLAPSKEFVTKSKEFLARSKEFVSIYV